MDLNLLLILVAAAFVLAVAYAAVNYLLVRRLKEGSRRMQEIAAAIREGANAFLRYEYRSVAVIGCALALLLWRARLPMPRVVALWNERGYTIYLWQIFAACAVLHATEPWLDARSSGLWGFLVMALLVFAANTAISYAACAYERACLRLIGAAGRAARRLLAKPPRNQ